MAYSAWLYLTVIFKDAEVKFSRYVELPFAPYPGLTLVFDDEGNEIFSVDSLEFYVPDEVFWLYETKKWSDDCPCKPADQCCVCHPEYFTKHGWEIEGDIARGEDRLYDYLPWVFPSDTSAASAAK